MPVTASSATCGAARSTCSRATSCRSPRLGTTMPDGRTIERRGILGIDSEGMLCAADELGLGDDHSGILILPPGTPLGRPLRRGARHPSRRAARRRRHSQPSRLLGLRRHRPRPRRPDGHRVPRHRARSLAPRRRAPHGAGRAASTASAAGVSRARSCRACASARARAWMQQRLTAAGMRPISNVVDVSNYVMLELNQPNHAYDLDTLGGGGFRVRTAARRRTDDHARRRRAHVHDERPADLRRRRPPDRCRRRDGRPRHRDHRRHDHGGARDRVVPAAHA